MAVAAGTKINQYTIVARLGSGGMGEVYLAQDDRLRRKVALKLLFEEVTKNEDWVRRFEQEAFAASALNHPNIITIYEIGQMGDSRFISAEFIDGQTLRERLRERNLQVTEALEIGIQIGAALVASHSAGIIHRDIKPENVMLRPDGYVKVLDFGLAKFTEERVSLVARSDPEAATQAQVNTHPGVVMGTVSYMSPEQASGSHVDARTDVFSLGVLLYEMLSGRLPFEGNTPSEVVISIIQKRQRPLARYTPEIPSELERIVAKALTKSRDDRYQSLKDLVIDLKRLKRQLELQNELMETPDAISIGQLDTAKTSIQSNPTSPHNILSAQVSTRSASSAEYIVTGLKRHKKATLMCSAIVLAAIIGTVYYLQLRSLDSVAVLPFSIVGSDPAMEQMGDELTEHIINHLAESPELRVISRSSIEQFKGQQIDPQSIGRQLEVSAVLVGRILKRDNGIIVSAELIDTRDRRQIWGMQRLTRIADLSLVPDEIAANVAIQLGIKPNAELQKRQNAEALYMKGRNAWNKRTTDGLNEAISHFNEALEILPNYAEAYAGLADCYNMLATYGAKPPKEAFPKAHDAAIKALAIDKNLAEAHAALAYTTFRGDWNWIEAEKEFRLAIQLNDDYASSHQWYANFLAAQGRFDEAIKETRRTQEIDKTSLIINSHFGIIKFLAHQYDDAIKECQKTVELDPSFFVARRYLGLSYTQKGMYKAAIEEFEKAISASGGSPLMRAEYASTLAASGDTVKAREELESLIQLSNHRYLSAYHIAAIYVALNDKEQAFQWLDRAFQDRADWMAFLNVDPRFDSLRSDSRFTALQRRMNL